MKMMKYSLMKKLKLKNVITYEKDNFVLDNVFDDN